MPVGYRERGLLEAMARYMARFGRPDVNLIDALDTRKSQSQLMVERAQQPWRQPEPHWPSATLSHLRAMGYRGDEDSLEADVRSLERQGLLVRTGSRSWRPEEGPE